MKESGILSQLDGGERRLQEALFEIVSSEASYLKSLNVLVFHFANSQQFSSGSSLLSSKDREVIFSNVLQVMTKESEMLYITLVSSNCVQMKGSESLVTSDEITER